MRPHSLIIVPWSGLRTTDCGTELRAAVCGLTPDFGLRITCGLRMRNVVEARPHACRSIAFGAHWIYDDHYMSAPTSRRTAPSRKQTTHDRILGAAARAIRRTGYAGRGLGEFMHAV